MSKSSHSEGFRWSLRIVVQVAVLVRATTPSAQHQEDGAAARPSWARLSWPRHSRSADAGARGPGPHPRRPSSASRAAPSRATPWMRMGRVRIAVLGKFNVGKSALTVRYLTRRFIGEYRSNEDLLYRQTVVVNGSLTDVEIFDVSGETRDTMTPEEASQLSADGAVVVYSIVDRASFEYARHVLALLGAVPGLRITLLANKADLAHLRAVQASEGRALAEAAAGAPFYEVSVAEDSADLYQAFELLVGECHALLATNNNNNNNSTNANYNNNSGSNNNANGADRQAQQQGGTAGRTRKFSVTKMLGTLIGSKSSSPPPAAPAPTASLQGTVVVCHKSELFRRGVLRSRRHKTSITASL